MLLRAKLSCVGSLGSWSSGSGLQRVRTCNAVRLATFEAKPYCIAFAEGVTYSATLTAPSARAACNPDIADLLILSMTARILLGGQLAVKIRRSVARKGLPG